VDLLVPTYSSPSYHGGPSPRDAKSSEFNKVWTYRVQIIALPAKKSFEQHQIIHPYQNKKYSP
jgi:hypothetical protein